MQIKFKKLSKNAQAPMKAKDGDAGFDLTATEIIRAPQYLEYRTGIAMEIPWGYVGLLFARSSITNKNLILKNCVGVIDPGYRGEITFRFLELPTMYKHLEQYGGVSPDQFGKYSIGDRIGQIIIYKLPEIHFTEVDVLSETERGEKGYGSTGN